MREYGKSEFGQRWRIWRESDLGRDENKER